MSLKPSQTKDLEHWLSNEDPWTDWWKNTKELEEVADLLVAGFSEEEIKQALLELIGGGVIDPVPVDGSLRANPSRRRKSPTSKGVEHGKR